MSLWWADDDVTLLLPEPAPPELGLTNRGAALGNQARISAPPRHSWPS